MDLRGASAESLATLIAEQDDALRDSAHAERVAQELFAVAAVFRADAALRRTATDAAVPVEARQGLVREVLGGKVDDTTLALVVSAVARRWLATRDLPDALERLGEVAVVKSVGEQAELLADELFGLAQLVASHPELRDALSDRRRPLEARAGVVEELLAGKAMPATLTLTKQALAGSYRTVLVALESYRRLAAEVRGEAVATARVARPLDDQHRVRLGEMLTRQYGRPVHLNVVVDPEVLGGVRVEIGNDVIDGTVVGRLDDARRRLAG